MVYEVPERSSKWPNIEIKHFWTLELWYIWAVAQAAEKEKVTDVESKNEREKGLREWMIDCCIDWWDLPFIYKTKGARRDMPLQYDPFGMAPLGWPFRDGPFGVAPSWITN